MERMRETWVRFRRKFWLAIYRWSGKHLGPEVMEYWDQHWWLLVKMRLIELGHSDLGMSTVKVLFYDGILPVQEAAREERGPREVRDNR